MSTTKYTDYFHIALLMLIFVRNSYCLQVCDTHILNIVLVPQAGFLPSRAASYSTCRRYAPSERNEKKSILFCGTRPSRQSSYAGNCIILVSSSVFQIPSYRHNDCALGFLLRPYCAQTKTVNSVASIKPRWYKQALQKTLTNQILIINLFIFCLVTN